MYIIGSLCETFASGEIWLLSQRGFARFESSQTEGIIRLEDKSSDSSIDFYCTGLQAVLKLTGSRHV
jgi:hypothetical protein